MFGNQFQTGFGSHKPVADSRIPITPQASSTCTSLQSDSKGIDGNEEVSLIDSLEIADFPASSFVPITDTVESDPCCIDCVSAGDDPSQTALSSVDNEVHDIFTSSTGPLSEYYRQSYAESPSPPTAYSQPIQNDVAPINDIQGHPVGPHPEFLSVGTGSMGAREDVSQTQYQNHPLTPPQTPHESDSSFATQRKGSEAEKLPIQPTNSPPTPPRSPLIQHQAPLLDISLENSIESPTLHLDAGTSAELKILTKDLEESPGTAPESQDSFIRLDPPSQPTITRQKNAMTMALQIFNFRDFNIEKDVEQVELNGFKRKDNNELWRTRPWNDTASKLQLRDDHTRLRISEIQYTLTNEKLQSTLTCKICTGIAQSGILLICKNPRCQDLTVCNSESCIQPALDTCRVGGHQFLAHYLCPKIQPDLPIQTAEVLANEFPVKNARTTAELWLSSSYSSDTVMLAYCDSTARLRTFYGIDCKVSGNNERIQYDIQARKLWPEEAQKVDMELLSVSKHPSCVPKLSSETIERCNIEGRKVVFTRLDCRLSSRISTQHHQQYDGLWIGGKCHDITFDDEDYTNLLFS